MTTRCHHPQRPNHRPAASAVLVWIDTWYNRKRLHSTNNMTSPIDYELANAA